MIPTIVCGRWNRFSAEYPQTVHLRQVRNLFDDRQCSPEQLAEAQDAVTKLLLKKLEQTGVTATTDGGMRWDSIYDVTYLIEGCQNSNHLAPIPKTNFFHRQPTVKLPLIWAQSLLQTDYLFARQHTRLPLTLTLPGPLSTALQTQNYAACGLERVAKHYANVFNQELKFLLRFKDISFIRVEESLLLDYPHNFDLFTQAARTLTAGLDTSHLALASPGNISSFDRFFELPFGIFFVDFVKEENNPAVLKNLPKEKRIVAGVVDARHPYQETTAELQRLIKTISNNLPAGSLALSANYDWHFLPWNKALEKLKRLAEAGQYV